MTLSNAWAGMHGWFAAVVILAASQPGLLSAQIAIDTAKHDFEAEVAVLLRDSCIECHNESFRMGGLRLDTKEYAFDSGTINPGHADESLLIQRLSDKELGLIMPPTGSLEKEQIRLLTEWVDQGANWTDGIALSEIPLATPEEQLSRRLLEAIRQSNHELIDKLIAHDSITSVTDRYGNTPLMQAAFYLDERTVKSLTKLGLDIDAKNVDGMTALMFGAHDARMVRLLIDAGADVNARSAVDRTPLLLACTFAGNLDSVQALLDGGARIDVADGRGWTPLIVAARTGDMAMLQRLLDSGVDINEGTAKRLGPGNAMTQSAWAGSTGAVQLLLDRGFSTGENRLGLPLIVASTHGWTEIVELLLAHGADANARVVTNYIPDTPLTAATYSDKLDSQIVEMLLDHGAEIDFVDKRKETAAILASKRGSTGILKMLGAETDALTDDAGDGAGVRESHASHAPDESQKRSAIEKSLSLLQASDLPFFYDTGCIACHQQSVSAIATARAQERAMAVDDEILRKQLKLTMVEFDKKRNTFLQRLKIGGTVHRISYLLWGMLEQGVIGTESTDWAIHELLGLQLANGSWVADAHRPPTEYSRFSATAISVRTIRDLAPEAMQPRVKNHVVQAREWLISATPFGNQEHAFRLLGLRWSGADEPTIAKQAEQLTSQQRQDGGWSQLPELPSDAYATGLALYALHVGGAVPTGDREYQRGLAYLIDTQQDDGSWHVVSRSMKFQPYFESGFPHGHDQWISSAGTAWATAAIALDLKPQREE